MEMEKYISRQELTELACREGYEVYKEEEVLSFSENIVKSIDPVERRNGAIDFASLNRVVVVNDDLSKSVLFWREAQLEFKEEVDPVTLMKSRTGYYKDTPENRAKGIVGKSYGDPKADDHPNIKLPAAFSKMKGEYAAAAKKGDKAAMGKIAAQMKAYEAKMKGAEAPSKD